MSDHIPDELLKEILSRVPVRRLLTFRFVSKSWKALIDSPEFIKLHLAYSLHTNSNQNLILEQYTLYSADYETLDKTNLADYKKLKPPLDPTFISTRILGSCNGLLCFMHTGNGIVLWNPSTGEYKELPTADFKWRVSFGFGYDSVNDDYKVVWFGREYERSADEFASEVKVYSLKSNSWKRIRDFPYFIRHICIGTLAYGALHWVVCRKPHATELVAAFDLRTEEFRLVPEPETSGGQNLKTIGTLGDKTIGTLGDCLCVLHHYYNDRLDLWVMKEYGVQESWMKMISIKFCDFVHKDFQSVKPLAYSKCGRRVLLEQDNRFLLWYDLETKSISYSMMQFNHRPDALPFRSHICSQSLVQLNGSS